MSYLFLARHGEALSPSQDPQQPLSEKGEQATKRMAFLLKQSPLPIDIILHSPKQRAKQTAEIFHQILAPNATMQEMHEMLSQDSVELFLNNIHTQDHSTLIVGHLPFLDKLLSYLLFQKELFTFFDFCNSAVVCLENDLKKWTLKWAVSPRLFEA